VYCDHCQTTVVEGARFCPFCGGKLTEAPVAEGSADAMDPSQAPTVALTVGPCESCGAPSLPGSTLCLPCTRAFESILGTQPAVPVAAAVTPTVPPVPRAADADAATLLQPQAPVLPSAPGGSTSPEAATVLTRAAGDAGASLDEDALDDDEEYEDEPDELMAEEAATVLTTAPPVPPPAPEPAAPAFSATDSMDWSTPATASSDHEAIVALPPWARKGPEADVEQAADAAPDAPDAEPVPWWERNGQPSPTAAAKPEVARYVPPPAAAPPASASLESTLARQAMRPKSPAAVAATIPAAPRASGGNRRRSLLIGAALAGVAAIGTPVMWKLAFASRPTVVSALPIESAAAPAPVAPRAERVHGTPAPAPAPATPRVYQDLQPLAPEPEAPAPVAAAPASAHATPKATPKVAPKKPVVNAAAPVAAPVAPPEPAPLLVATPPPVVAAPATAAAPPASVQAEAVPLGQIFEVSQVEARPSVTSRFDPVLPARIASTTPVVVIVRVLVSPSGRAVESSPVKNPSNDPGVGAAAAAIVRQWGFAPARKKGQPVSCWVNVGVVFKAASGN
jgi:TonB family protein